MQVKAGICCAHLESDPDSAHGMHEAHTYFDNLLELPLAENADLWLTVAEELLQLQHIDEVCSLSCSNTCHKACLMESCLMNSETPALWTHASWTHAYCTCVLSSL